METPLHDMHCHLDFMTSGEEVAQAAGKVGTLLFANTVTPAGWLATSRAFSQFGNVRVGFGMHPWWVEDDTGAPAAEFTQTRQRREALELLDRHRPTFVGEIGLDFGKRHQSTRTAQVQIFQEIARWCAESDGCTISLHSVHAARETLDVLQQTGALFACNCIFHWFSGPSDQLKRAIEAGCYFSCGPRMLATKRGPEYVKAIPTHRLLLETDAPPEQGSRYPFSALRADLECAADTIAHLKGEDALAIIDRTSRELLGAEKRKP